MAYYNVSVKVEDERGSYGYVRNRVEASSDASAITYAQSLATWADGNSGAQVVGIRITEVISATITATVKANPNTDCEIEIQGNLLFKTGSPNPNKSYNIFVPTIAKSNFLAKGRKLTASAKTAWENAFTSATGATEFFADSSFYPLKSVIRGTEKWTKARR